MGRYKIEALLPQEEWDRRASEPGVSEFFIEAGYQTLEAVILDKMTMAQASNVLSSLRLLRLDRGGDIMTYQDKRGTQPRALECLEPGWIERTRGNEGVIYRPTESPDGD